MGPMFFFFVLRAGRGSTLLVGTCSWLLSRVPLTVLSWRNNHTMYTSNYIIELDVAPHTMLEDYNQVGSRLGRAPDRLRREKDGVDASTMAALLVFDFLVVTRVSSFFAVEANCKLAASEIHRIYCSVIGGTTKGDRRG